MANNVKSEFKTLTTKDTLPLSTNTAVTITAASGESNFTLSAEITDDFIAGSFIWDTVNDKLYKVRELGRDKVGGTIIGTFDNTLAASAIKYIKSKDLKNVTINVKVIADSTIDGQNLSAGDSFNDESFGATYGSRWITPHIYDGATGNFLYNIKKH